MIKISPNDKLAIAVILVLNAALAANFYAAQAQQPTATNATAVTNMTAATNATAQGGGAAATNATNQIITNLTWWKSSSVVDQMVQFTNPTGPVVQEPLSPANIQYQQTDPVFAKLVQTLNDCLTHYNSIFQRMSTTPEKYPLTEEINRQDLCTDTVSQGLGLLCDALDFVTYDMAKCEEARIMTDTYLAVAETLYG